MSEKINVRIPNEQGRLGRYDNTTGEILSQLDAEAVALIVMGGKIGSGFSLSLQGRPEIALAFASAMEDAAKDLRKLVASERPA